MNRLEVLLYLISVIFSLLISYVTTLDAESIVGGDYAEEDQIKYQISLELYGYFICGGAIIANNFVLTAAHCVLNRFNNIKAFPFKVIAGTIDLNTKKGAVEVYVETIYVHEQSEREGLNDIAVLKLKENLGLDKNPHLEKINLPTDNNTYVGKIATVSGYGFISVKTFFNKLTDTLVEYNGYSDDLLKYAKVKIIDDEECQSKVTYINPLATNICGYVIQRGSQPEGICSGDSGGPLVYNKTIIGIISNSPIGCREDKEPAVYTRVTSYVPFIQNILEGHPTNAKEATIVADETPIVLPEYPENDSD